jgi:hypothetical protein
MKRILGPSGILRGPAPCRLLATLLLLLPFVSCKSAYYGTMGAFGVQKRDILVERVEEGRDAQAEAKEEIKTTLEAFREVEDFEGGELEKLYNRLKGQLERAEKRVKGVEDRIDSIETVASDLFKEWEKELDQFSNADLRRRSQETLDETRARYRRLIEAMRKAESMMQPVLSVFQDHVLFLKHNLNAAAIASLEDSLISIETDVAELISQMEASIAEADEFISNMSS